MTDQELVELAFTMLERSYVPYSHFPVGAALDVRRRDGVHRLQCGNAAYGSSICAERTALVKAVSEGHRGRFHPHRRGGQLHRALLALRRMPPDAL